MSLRTIKPYAVAIVLLAYVAVGLITYKLAKVGKEYLKIVWRDDILHR